VQVYLCVGVQVSASCRLRRVYLAERLHGALELAEDCEDCTTTTGTCPGCKLTPRHHAAAAAASPTNRSVFDNCPAPPHTAGAALSSAR